jgi:hypothetical protein
MATKKKKLAKKKAPAKKTSAAKKAAPKKAAPKKAAPKKAAPKKAAPKKAAPRKPAPKAKAKPAPKAKAKPAPKAKAKPAPKAKVVAKPRMVAKPKRVAKPKAEKPAAKAPISRRDGAGHLDPTYEANLMAMSHKKDRGGPELAFVGGRHTDDLAESMGEQVVEQATSGEYDGEDVLDQEVTEEQGGPFVESTGGREYGHDVDASNPKDAEREPFPKT